MNIMTLVPNARMLVASITLMISLKHQESKDSKLIIRVNSKNPSRTFLSASLDEIQSLTALASLRGLRTRIQTQNLKASIRKRRRNFLSAHLSHGSLPTGLQVGQVVITNET